MLITFTTVSSQADGEKLAAKIVEAGLAACVQVLPRMTSVYLWKGKINTDREHLLLIKTVDEKWDALREFISANHTYEVPEIVAIEAVRVSDPYLEWIQDAISG